MVRDVVVHGIAARARLADAPTAEGDALQGLRPVRSMGIGEGAGIVIPHARSIERLGLRPVGEVCVVGFHGRPGLDLRGQVNQIVRRLQVVGGVGRDVARAAVGDDLLGEGVGGGPVVVELPGGEAVGLVVGESVKEKELRK